MSDIVDRLRLVALKEDAELEKWPRWADLCNDAADRIEELRQFQLSLHPTELDDYMKTYYVINDRQIVDAVEVVNRHAGLRAGRLGWRILEQLGIKQCDHCNGGGTLIRMQGEVSFNCPTCNGDGFVVGAS